MFKTALLLAASIATKGKLVGRRFDKTVLMVTKLNVNSS